MQLEDAHLSDGHVFRFDVRRGAARDMAVAGLVRRPTSTGSAPPFHARLLRSVGFDVVEAVSPDRANPCPPAYNRFGHPPQLTREKLEDVLTYRTDQDGSVEVVTDGERYWISTER